MKETKLLTVRVLIDGKECDNVFPLLEGKTAHESFYRLFSGIHAKLRKREVPNDFPAQSVNVYDEDFKSTYSFKARVTVEDLRGIRRMILSEYYSQTYLDQLLKEAEEIVKQLTDLKALWVPHNPAPAFEEIDE